MEISVHPVIYANGPVSAHFVIDRSKWSDKLCFSPYLSINCDAFFFSTLVNEVWGTRRSRSLSIHNKSLQHTNRVWNSLDLLQFCIFCYMSTISRAAYVSNASVDLKHTKINVRHNILISWENVLLCCRPFFTLSLHIYACDKVYHMNNAKLQFYFHRLRVYARWIISGLFKQEPGKVPPNLCHWIVYKRWQQQEVSLTGPVYTTMQWLSLDNCNQPLTWRRILFC